MGRVGVLLILILGCSETATVKKLVPEPVMVAEPVPEPNKPAYGLTGDLAGDPEGCPETNLVPDLRGSALCMGPTKPHCNKVPCNHKVTYEALLEPYSAAFWFRDQILENPITTITFVKSDLLSMSIDFTESVCDAFWTKVTFKNGKTALIHRESSWLESDFSNCDCKYLIGTGFSRKCTNWGEK